MALWIASSTPVSLLPTISLSRYTWLLIAVLPIGQPSLDWSCLGGLQVSAVILLHSGGAWGGTATTCSATAAAAAILDPFRAEVVRRVSLRCRTAG
jgi:hypothetical protein